MFSISPEEPFQAARCRCCSQTWWRPCCTSSLAFSTPLVSASVTHFISLLKSPFKSVAGKQKFHPLACNSQSHLAPLLPLSSQHSGGEVETPGNYRKNASDFWNFLNNKIPPKLFRFPTMPGGVQVGPAFPPPQYQDPQSGGCSRM